MMMVDRLQNCELMFNDLGKFVRECLFDKSKSVADDYLPEVD